MDPRSWTTGTAVGPVPQRDYTALTGSVICADKISGVNSDVLNLSVSVKSVNTGRQDTATPSVDETLPSHQGPAAEMILSNKLRLIDCLSADPSFILQNVQQCNIISNRQYGNLKDLSQREETVIELIDLVISKGEKFCSLFLEVLKQPDILETYPNLNKIKW
ncbi:Caspase recruitment domain containing protein 6 [Dissostichus eleginoides]|uniref:Caspase recruitment domain containing protein 6 n=1 Tax=Dissostichus eleginoides TaxID=100907 RepID=A0AAD9CM59_DISEL|nr:Caspase recruitment domain containing protein 6 [Dissostichus eleginoides]